MKKGFEKIFSGFMAFWVGIGVFALSYYLLPFFPITSTEVLAGSILLALLFASFTFLVSPALFSIIQRSTNKLGNQIFRIPLSDLLGTIIGLIIGLIIAVLLNSVLGDIQVIGTYISLFLLVVIPYVFTVVGYRKRAEIFSLFTGGFKKREKPVKEEIKTVRGSAKIIDTSAIIDGRILPICETGFLEGELVITNFVLDELRHIADSDDDLRRAKGRRGLDTLNRMRTEFGDRVIISSEDFPEITEVDAKLVRLAQEKDGGVVTTDFNLNKVAQLQGVPVYNVNELSNAVKPVVIPGEEMVVTVIKAGKERNQGVAYLDDGTMIVIEDGRGFIGQTIDAVVTSVLQTAAGRMIFVRSK